VAQGLPWGFVTVTLAGYLSQRGLGKSELAALLAMTTLPWSFKWCWGPVIDYLQIPSLGRRRPWIIFAQFMMIVTMAGVLLIPDLILNVKWLIVVVFVHNIFGSMQDVGVDALAVDLLPENERGRANGFMYGSSYLGTIIGGAGLGLVASRYGLRSAVFIQLCVLASIFLVPLLIRERPGDRFIFPRRGQSEKAVTIGFLSMFVEIAYAFRYPLTWLCAILALAVKIGMGVSMTTGVNVFIQHHGYTDKQYSLVMGGSAVAVGLTGSILGGLLADRYGASRVAFAAAGALGLVWCGFGLLENQWALEYRIDVFLCIQEFFMSVLSVALFALFMGVVVPGVAATQFTAYMALMNLSSTFGAGLAGSFPDTAHAGIVFIYIGLFQIVPILLLLLVERLIAYQKTQQNSKGEDDWQEIRE